MKNQSRLIQSIASMECTATHSLKMEDENDVMSEWNIYCPQPQPVQSIVVSQTTDFISLSSSSSWPVPPQPVSSCVAVLLLSLVTEG